MSNKITKSPQIRFAGFEDAWEQFKLSDVADYYDGTHQTPKYTHEGVKFISVENIKNIWETDKYISENDYEKQFKIKPQINDIFMTRITAGVIGDTALVEQDEPLAYYVSLALLRPKSIVPLFLEKYINSPPFKNELHMRIIHTAFPKKINLGDIGECGLWIPNSKKEQGQIGEFFKQLDHTITLHQRKLELLKRTKKSLLQKMFPKDGANVPEIRLVGFTDAWEQRKLGEITQIKTGSSDLQDAVGDGEYPFFVRSENIERSNRWIFDGEAILIPGEGRLGEIYHYINGKFDYHQRVYKISNFTDSVTDGKYILYYMQRNFKRHALKFTVKATVDSLRLPMLTEFEVVLPSLEEQRKVSAIFSHLDNFITLHQRELDSLKNLKKSLLHQMFI
ncbi:restriction endonuclease subunit S [Cohnella sp. GCM10020058]|uniref:restriction endonuclease subunit S n=1 Tax=Cohnella sp. GCM10020058 TaxID=3317330 RepID=UPI0036337124